MYSKYYGWLKVHLEVPDERCDATVRLVVMFLMGQLLQLRQERYGVPRCKEGQQVRWEKLRHLSPE